MKIADMPLDLRHPGKHIDPETGIWPIAARVTLPTTAASCVMSDLNLGQ